MISIIVGDLQKIPNIFLHKSYRCSPALNSPFWPWERPFYDYCPSVNRNSNQEEGAVNGFLTWDLWHTTESFPKGYTEPHHWGLAPSLSKGCQQNLSTILILRLLGVRRGCAQRGLCRQSLFHNCWLHFRTQGTGWSELKTGLALGALGPTLL